MLLVIIKWFKCDSRFASSNESIINHLTWMQSSSGKFSMLEIHIKEKKYVVREERWIKKQQPANQCRRQQPACEFGISSSRNIGFDKFHLELSITNQSLVTRVRFRSDWLNGMISQFFGSLEELVCTLFYTLMMNEKQQFIFMNYYYMTICL